MTLRMKRSMDAFQSTHSLRSATLYDADNPKAMLFQSTHSLRSATPDSWPQKKIRDVSIHALLAECDR